MFDNVRNSFYSLYSAPAPSTQYDGKPIRIHVEGEDYATSIRPLMIRLISLVEALARRKGEDVVLSGQITTPSLRDTHFLGLKFRGIGLATIRGWLGFQKLFAAFFSPVR